MIFDKTSWERICEGFFVRDCTIGFEDGRLGFYMVEESDDDHLDDGWRTRFVAIKLANPVESRFFTLTGNNLSFATISSAWAPDQTEFLIVDSGRRTWSYKPKTYKGNEPVIPFDGKGYGYSDLGEVGCSITRVQRVGTSIFAVGAPMRVFQRMPDQQWLEHKGIPIPEALKSKDDNVITEALSDSNLFDIAGFSESDMYAVGDAGTVWHYDGKKWKQIAFPSNLRLQTVTCGGDGQVYITDIRGSLWKGRASSWEKIFAGNASIPYADSAWFNDQFWCANDYGMMVLEGKQLVPAHNAKTDPIPTEVALYSHRIDVSPDGQQMLVCGGYGAALNKNGKWEVLFSSGQFES